MSTLYKYLLGIQGSLLLANGAYMLLFSPKIATPPSPMAGTPISLIHAMRMRFLCQYTFYVNQRTLPPVFLSMLCLADPYVGHVAIESIGHMLSLITWKAISESDSSGLSLVFHDKLGLFEDVRDLIPPETVFWGLKLEGHHPMVSLDGLIAPTPGIHRLITETGTAFKDPGIKEGSCSPGWGGGSSSSGSLGLID